VIKRSHHDFAIISTSWWAFKWCQ